ncbi:MAG TPA: tetratricopeptide repeat protein [Longimicrobiales bacterium]|nr:tetratricopeptide repeat protein [Longimicrobiales bacterium]
MVDADRVLRPLHEAAPSIEKLETYESPAVLAEALRATWLAVDRTLRTLLRSDATVPDAIRMTALSADQMPSDAVITQLRRRDLVSLSLAGRAHELSQAALRAERGDVRAADADSALDLVRVVTEEVRSAARRTAEPRILSGSVLDSEPEVGGVVEVRRDGVRSPRRRLVLVLLGVAALLAAVLLVWRLTRPSHLEQGISAFREGRMGVAEQEFRAALAGNRTDVTAQLYLARLLRQERRYQEAADVLRSAAVRAPRDAAVRRELGYLFLDLNRASTAAEQFEQAVELDPEDALNWVGMIEATARAGDTAAAREWLSRAPADAQQLINRTRF